MESTVWYLLHYQAVRMYHLYEGVFVMIMKKQMSVKGLALPALALCSFLLSGNIASAALVNYSFSGGISSISGALLSLPP